jgi:hypothetical protein
MAKATISLFPKLPNIYVAIGAADVDGGTISGGTSRGVNSAGQDLGRRILDQETLRRIVQCPANKAANRAALSLNAGRR